MKTLKLSLIVFSIISTFLATKVDISDKKLQKKLVERETALNEYIEFLGKKDQNPINYIFELYKKYDIIILCERAHSEITQYELITNIIKDKRFSENVGHVFLEIGNSNLQVFFKNFLLSDSLSDEKIEESLKYIIQNCSSSPVWQETNYYNFIEDIYYLNKNLSLNKKVHVYPSNMPFNWEEMSAEKYTEQKKERPKIRDKIIANQIIERYDEILNSTSNRKKALIIMNYRHAFPHIESMVNSDLRHRDNVGGYLMETYPGRVANVMLNSFRVVEADENGTKIAAIQDGKWDAAFQSAGNPEIGFSFENSPFGNDGFDYWPFQNGYLYKDIFTGFIFYKPLEEHIMKYGHPGIFDSKFIDEYIRRNKIVNPSVSKEKIEENIDELSKVQEYKYDIIGEEQYRKLIESINKWLINNY